MASNDLALPIQSKFGSTSWWDVVPQCGKRIRCAQGKVYSRKTSNGGTNNCPGRDSARLKGISTSRRAALRNPFRMPHVFFLERPPLRVLQGRNSVVNCKQLRVWIRRTRYSCAPVLKAFACRVRVPKEGRCF